MKYNEIRVNMHGGCLVAGRNLDPDYDGIYVVFEADDGSVVDVVLVECKEENNRKKIDVYTYEDVYNEDFTKKYTLNVKDIYKALDI